MSSTRSVPRLSWHQLPASVKAAFADLLGAPIERAVSQEEGFSPGLAARCELPDGRSVFLKATARSVNIHSREMMVHEGVINHSLPDDAPVPAFLGSIEVGEWFGLAFADVQGRLPDVPWHDADLDAVFDAVDGLDLPTRADVPHLAELLRPAFVGWANLAVADDDLTKVEPWLDRTMVRRLADLTSDWTTSCPPESLVHADIRADNVLIDADGLVHIVDWANAGLGPAWLDVVFMIPSIAMQGGPPPAELWARSRHAKTTDPHDVDVMVAAVAGYFTESGRRPPVTEIPMLRAFQEAQGVWAREWVRSRLRS